MLLVVNLSEGSSIDRGVVVGDVATLLTPRPQPPGVFVPPTPSDPVRLPSQSTENDYPRLSHFCEPIHACPSSDRPSCLFHPSWGSTMSVCQHLGASGGYLCYRRLSVGYRLPLLLSPPLAVTPLLPSYPAAHLPLLPEHIAALLSTDAIVRVDVPSMCPGFYSRLFLVPKKNSSKLRMIHVWRVCRGRSWAVGLPLQLLLMLIALPLGPCMIRGGIPSSLTVLPRVSIRRLPQLRSSRISCFIFAVLALFVGVPLPRLFRTSILCWRRRRVFVFCSRGLCDSPGFPVGGPAQVVSPCAGLTALHPGDVSLSAAAEATSPALAVCILSFRLQELCGFLDSFVHSGRLQGGWSPSSEG